MIQVCLHPDGPSHEVDPSDIVRLGKVAPGHDGPDPTLVILGSGPRFLVTESIRTISARVGNTAPLSEYDDTTSDRPAALGLLWVAAMTKSNEDDEGDDPTLVHLANGEEILVGESIRTLSARLSLTAGTTAVDVDAVGTERPAAVIPAHVEGVLATSGGEGRCLVRLAGGHALVCNDDRTRLRERLRAAMPDAPAATPRVGP